MDLNKNPKISQFYPQTYSMVVNNIDFLKERKIKSEYSFLDLQKLLEQFKLDIEFNEKDGLYYKNKLKAGELSIPGFVSKSYYSADKNYAYNFPPVGPIPVNFYCISCGKVGPRYHNEECFRPFETSLYLTDQGVGVYENKIIPSNPERYSYLKAVLKPNAPYNTIVKKSGQVKAESSSEKALVFRGSVQLKYQSSQNTECIVRISRNGVINIISANYNDLSLPELIMKRINETDALNLTEYNKKYPTKKKFSVDESITYKTLLTGQFNLFPTDLKAEYLINLQTLNKFLIELFSRDSSVSGYYYNSGDTLSRTGASTNPYIKFIFVEPAKPAIKVSVMIYQRGAVQLRASYTEEANRSEDLLTNKYLQNLYLYLKGILADCIKKSANMEFPVISQEQEKLKKGLDTIENKQPICRKSDRPIPYSFYGVCPTSDKYVRFEGIKRKTGNKLYEPCCYKLKDSGKDSFSRFYDIIRKGFPRPGTNDAVEFELAEPDTKSFVYKPGTKMQESRSFRGLDSMDRDLLKSCVADYGYFKEENILDRQTVQVKKDLQTEYMKLVGSKKFVGQSYSTLTFKNISMFTKNPYCVLPVIEGSIEVLLFFDSEGDSFFVKNDMEFLPSTLESGTLYYNTLIFGYLQPSKDQLVFYPVDLLLHNSTDYRKKVHAQRYSLLSELVGKFQTNETFIIKFNGFVDVNIVNGSKYFLETFKDTISLVFMPLNDEYNKNVLKWNNNNSISNKQIVLMVNDSGDGSWSLSLDSKKIPSSLLPQEDNEGGGIKIPKNFINKYSLKSNQYVLFEINSDLNDKINIKNPLKPISIFDEKLNEYQDVINILESIKNPIGKSFFTKINQNPIGFKLGTAVYYFVAPNKPLQVINI
jgi:hypothetical protein